MKVYLLPGIGVDHRIFTYLRLPDGFEPVHIPWEQALPGDTLSDYAHRLIEKYISEGPFVLLGLSLGGIVAAEMAKKCSPACTILIGSIPVASHLPPYYRV